MNANTLARRARKLAFLPNTSAYGVEEILEEANTALKTMLVPAVMRANGEFFTEISDLTPDSYGYVIFPKEAVSSTARVLTWVDSSGRETGPLKYLDQADMGVWAGSGAGGSGAISVEQPDGSFTTVTPTRLGTPMAFVLTPNGAQIVPTQPTGAVRMRYPRLPGELVEGLNTKVLTVATVNPGVGFTTTCPDGVSVTSGALWAGVDLDVTLPESPYRRIALDDTIAYGGVANTWTYTGDTVLRVGMILTFPTYSYIPNAPLEWHELLMYYTAARLSDLNKDYTRKNELLADAARMDKELVNIAQARAKQNSKVLSAWRGHSFNPRGVW